MNDYPFILITGIGVMLLLFTSFLFVFITTQRKKLKYQQDMQQLRETQQNQLIEAAIRSEEIERHRIAETLHDEVGAILSSSKLHIQAIKAESLDKQDRQLHEKGMELLNEGIQKVRGISHNLHSSILKEFGLNEAIRHFVNNLSRESVLKTSTELDDTYTTKNAENDISIYRMAQELLNNIMKHSGAKEIKISSVFKDDALTMTIFHDGAGLSQQQFEEFRYKKEGLGLKNIQNRIILLKGKIDFHTAFQDNRIIIFIPVNTSI